MNANELDFNGLAKRLLSQSRDLVVRWLPGGRLMGAEWTCGSLRGEHGDSFRVNVNTGLWSDFAASGVSGGDLISLYAAINGLSQGDAFKALNDAPAVVTARPLVPVEVTKPPASEAVPEMVHSQYGKPSAWWCYRDPDGSVVHYVARYDTSDGKKQIIPWSWSIRGGWITKGWPAPRRLYGLEELKKYPKRPVLIVEGEKCVEEARKLFGELYVVVTWPNGAQAVDKADWEPVYGRTVLVMPDADKGGIAAGDYIGRLLKLNGGNIHKLDVSGQPEGWDIADAVESGWSLPTFIDWAKPRKVSVAEPGTIIVEQGILVGKDAAAQRVTINLSPSEEDGGPLSLSVQELFERCGVAQTKSGPILNMDNVLRILNGYEPLTNLVWFDEFHQRIFTNWGTGQRREWTDGDDLKLLQILQSQLGMRKIDLTNVQRAVRRYAFDRKRNEPRDWFESLKWDGEGRIFKFFSTYYSSETSSYIYQAASNFWIGMVARIYRPGCKLDNMIVLEGSQGIGKSQSLKVIGGEWYAEANENIQTKDFFQVLSGKLILEIGELDSFSKAEVTRIKQVISCANDRYRMPYAHHSQDYPRQSVFVGTTNEDNYLKDPTGGRRFWPITVKNIDLDKLSRDREQLFAEAIVWFKQGEPWWRMPEDETRREQEARRFKDAWYELISPWLKDKYETTVTIVARDCLGIEPVRIDKSCQMRIAAILKELNWAKNDGWRNGKKDRFWTRPSTVTN